MLDLALLAVYAHPDDEQGVTGTLARYGRAGGRTGLICATRGECGEIADPGLATPATLGRVREQELRGACAVAGVAQLWFLDYRDSGMAGTPQNEDPRAFVRAAADTVVGKLVAIMRDFRPQVLLTFDESGAYGHPDHIAIHHWTRAAFAAAGDPARYPAAGAPWMPARLFYASIPRRNLRRMIDLVGRNDPNSAFRGIDPDKMGLPDEAITNVLDVSDFIDLKQAALSRHATQLNPNSPWARLPPALQRSWRSKEYFAFAAGIPLPAGGDQGDLFAGLR